MKEFVEKLIERLEEELKLADGEKEKCARGNPLMFDNAKGYSTGISTAISIVKDLASEHNNDFCEWEIVSDKDIHREYKPMCSEDGFVEITGYFDYEICPYCGKKIKVVE